MAIGRTVREMGGWLVAAGAVIFVFTPAALFIVGLLAGLVMFITGPT